MEEQTFRSRLVELLGKSRKAVRLYSNVSRSKRGSALAEVQATEWLNTNKDLVIALSSILDNLSARSLVDQANTLLEQYLTQYQITVEEMHGKKRKLIEIVDRSDFTQANILSRELVSLKARAQALQAAHNELKNVVKRSRPVAEAHTNTTPSLFESNDADKPTTAKIIPLRRKISLG